MSKLRRWEWAFAIALILLAWGLRLCCLEDVPPGWRDDELINTHALSGKPLEGEFPLYFVGASGHEPLYHYLHAGVHAVLDYNVLSGHILSIALGTLTAALTYALARRLFPQKPIVAVVASLGLASSFWSLMYSRFALRHVTLPPFVLAIFLLLPIHNSDPQLSRSTKLTRRETTRWLAVGLLLGVSLYTYPAARLLPGLMVLPALHLALCHRERFRQHWRGFVLALVLMAIVALPLGLAINRGRSAAAAQGIGADARLAELALPLRELQAGNPRPFLETLWTTLGMFHATGDPEWLYNIPGRPVFNLLGGALLWAGVALCLYRWRRTRYFLLLAWLGTGLLPAFLSTPPSSLSHTILAQPAAYLLPAVAIDALVNWGTGILVSWCTGKSMRRWSDHQSTNIPIYRFTKLVLAALLPAVLLVTNAGRDLHDYFVTWPQHGMVRTLYRADYRDVARYLTAHRETNEVAISSSLLGPWDRLALQVDAKRDDLRVRLFNPERALIWVEGNEPSNVILTTWPDPSPAIEELLASHAGAPERLSPHLTRYRLQPIDCDSPQRFANGLALAEARWWEEQAPGNGEESILLTTWCVTGPIDLPPMPVIANPPPPGVYAGPRLSVFAHLLDADGQPLAVDDGLWVDPLTLQPGDRFVQLHRFDLSDEVSIGPYTLELGLYDPKNGERWTLLDAEGQPFEDRVIFQ